MKAPVVGTVMVAVALELKALEIEALATSTGRPAALAEKDADVAAPPGT
jgi:hypothetical protein